MTTTDKPGDPADKAADGAFGGVHSHRAGYGDDKLQRVVNWLRDHPTATLASGEGALLLAENDRLRAAIERVRALRTEFGWCARCSCVSLCPTLRALDGEP